jgi:hypothetical protein
MKQKPLRSLDLFSGIGGLTMALQGIAEPRAYCDIDPAAQAASRDGCCPTHDVRINTTRRWAQEPTHRTACPGGPTQSPLSEEQLRSISACLATRSYMMRTPRFPPPAGGCSDACT